ncbi:MAG: HAMP domain-containing histidine kinase [Proteobacteria bacterium]|nr:HAMP domain-containing histidine kinase [Pseudomonadota bacterium]
MTVKNRITLLVALAGLITNLLFVAIVFYELLEQPFELLDRELKEEAFRVVRMSLSGPGTSRFPAVTGDGGMYPYWFKVYKQDSSRILYQSPLAEQIILPFVKPGSSTMTRAAVSMDHMNTVNGIDHKMAFRIRSFVINVGHQTYNVQIARSMEKLEEEIWELVYSIGAGLVFFCIALVVISHFIAGKILEPIGHMKDLTKEISEKNLNQRIPAGEGQDEFNELAQTINWMLDRLQNSFERQREFLFDTSHELKTPLTTLRLIIDDIHSSEGNCLPLSVKDQLSTLNNHILRMERLVKDLLNLSSLEVLPAIDPKPVHMTELLTSLCEDYRLFADAQNVHMDIRLPGQLIIPGDRDTLHRAFSNILDNAIKYNVNGGQVQVTGAFSDGNLTITISNTGPGIPGDETHKVFNQFYRLELSRSLHHGGSGLGLAIAKKIVDRHNGTLTCESRPDGWTTMTVVLT